MCARAGKSRAVKDVLCRARLETRPFTNTVNMLMYPYCTLLCIHKCPFLPLYIYKPALLARWRVFKFASILADVECLKTANPANLCNRRGCGARRCCERRQGSVQDDTRAAFRALCRVFSADLQPPIRLIYARCRELRAACPHRRLLSRPSQGTIKD